MTDNKEVRIEEEEVPRDRCVKIPDDKYAENAEEVISRQLFKD